MCSIVGSSSRFSFSSSLSLSLSESEEEQEEEIEEGHHDGDETERENEIVNRITWRNKSLVKITQLKESEFILLWTISLRSGDQEHGQRELEKRKEEKRTINE
jgi:hypothetical protein